MGGQLQIHNFGKKNIKINYIDDIGKSHWIGGLRVEFRKYQIEDISGLDEKTLCLIRDAVNKRLNQKIKKVVHLSYLGDKYTSTRSLFERSRHIKSIVSFKDIDFIENHFIVHPICARLDDPLFPIKTGYELIQSKNINVLTQTTPVTLLEETKVILQNILPYAVFFPVPPVSFSLMSFVLKLCSGRVYYHNHGLINDAAMIAIPSVKKDNQFVTRWSGFKKYFGCGENFKKFITAVIPQSNIELLGLTQFDYMFSVNLRKNEMLLKKYYNIERHRKVILFAAGGIGEKKAFENDYESYYRHVLFLYDYCKRTNSFMFIKTKYGNVAITKPGSKQKRDELSAIYCDNKHVAHVPGACNIYDFFWADVIVVEQASTVLVEAALANVNVIESHVVEDVDHFLMKKLGFWPRTTTFIELEKSIQFILTRKDWPDFLEQTYQNNRVAFLDYHLKGFDYKNTEARTSTWKKILQKTYSLWEEK